MALDTSVLDSYLKRGTALTPADLGQVDVLLEDLATKHGDEGALAAQYYVDQFVGTSASYHQHMMGTGVPQAVKVLYWGTVPPLADGIVPERVVVAKRAAATEVAEKSGKPQLIISENGSQKEAVVHFAGQYALTTRIPVSNSTAEILQQFVPLMPDRTQVQGPANQVQVILEILAFVRDTAQVMGGKVVETAKGKIGVSKAQYDAVIADLAHAAEVQAKAQKNSIDFFLGQGLNTQERPNNDALFGAYNWTKYELKEALPVEKGVLYSNAEKAKQGAAEVASPDRMAIAASGQAADPFEEIFRKWQLVPQMRDIISRIARKEKEITTKLKGLTGPDGRKVVRAVIDIEKWLKMATEKPEEFKTLKQRLFPVEVSLVLNNIASILNFEYERLRHGLSADAISAGIGVSQGEAPMLYFNGSMTLDDELMGITLAGVAVQKGLELMDERPTMLQVNNLHIDATQEIADQVNREMKLAGTPSELQITVINDDYTTTITSPNLAALQRAEQLVKDLAVLRGKEAKEGGRGMKKDLPKAQMLASTSAPFHHTIGQRAAFDYYKRLVTALGDEWRPKVSRDASAFPVFSTNDGTDIMIGEMDPWVRVVQDMTQNRMDYRLATRSVHALFKGTGRFLNAGADPGSSAAAYMNLRGAAYEFVDVTNPAGVAKAANADAARDKKPTAAAPKPQLVTTAGGTPEVRTAWTDWSGFPAVGIPGQTPVTLPRMTAALSSRGYFIELRTGDLIDASDLEREALEISKMQEEMVGHRSLYAINVMMIHRKRAELIDKAIELYKKGHGCRFITLVAGVPDAATIDKCIKAGMKLSIKIGSVDQYMQLVDLIKANPQFAGQIALQLECKTGGGHFGPETVQEMWPRVAHEARKYFACVLRAGDVVDADDVTRALTVGIPTGSGVATPFDGALIGSAAMAFEETPINPETRHLLTTMQPNDIVDFYSEFGAPVHYYRNAYYDLLRRLDEVAKATQLVNKDGAKAPRAFTTAERNEVVSRLNSGGNPKPWFSTAVRDTSLWDRLQSDNLFDVYSEIVSRAQSSSFDFRTGRTSYNFQTPDLRDFVSFVDKAMQIYLQGQSVDLTWTAGKPLYEALPRRLWDRRDPNYVSWDQLRAYYEEYQEKTRLLSGDMLELRRQFIRNGAEFDSDAFYGTVEKYRARLDSLHRNELGGLFPTGVTRERFEAIGATVQALSVAHMNSDMDGLMAAAFRAQAYKTQDKAVQAAMVDDWLSSLDLPARQTLLTEAMAGQPNAAYRIALNAHLSHPDVDEKKTIKSSELEAAVKLLFGKMQQSMEGKGLADTLRAVPSIYYHYDTTYGEWYDMTRGDILARFKALHTRADGSWIETALDRPGIEPSFKQTFDALAKYFASYGDEGLKEKPNLNDRTYVQDHIWVFRDGIYLRQLISMDPTTLARDYRTGISSFANVAGADPQWTALTPGMAITRMRRSMSGSDYLDEVMGGVRDQLSAAGVPTVPAAQLGQTPKVVKDAAKAFDGIDGVSVTQETDANNVSTIRVTTASDFTLASSALSPVAQALGTGPVALALLSENYQADGETKPNRIPGMLVGDPNTMWEFKRDAAGNLTEANKYDLSLVDDPTNPASLAKGLKISIKNNEGTVTVSVTATPKGSAKPTVTLSEQYRVEQVSGHDRLVMVDGANQWRRNQDALAPVFGVDTDMRTLPIDTEYESTFIVGTQWVRDAVEAGGDHLPSYVYGSTRGYIDHLEGKGKPKVVPLGDYFAMGISSALQTIYPDALRINPLDIVHQSERTTIEDGKHAREGDVLKYVRKVVGYEAGPEGRGAILRERAQIYRIMSGPEFIEYSKTQSPYGEFVGISNGQISFRSASGEVTTLSLDVYLAQMRTQVEAKALPGDGELIATQENAFFVRSQMPAGVATIPYQETADKYETVKVEQERPAFYAGIDAEKGTLKYTDFVNWYAPDQDQVDLFAETGDSNLIHTDQDAARFAGLPGTIVHGELIRKIVSDQLARRIADGDPTRVTDVAIQWSDMTAVSGGLMTTKAYVTGLSDSKSVVRFEVLNAAGKPVAKGTAKISPLRTALLAPGQGTLEAGMHEKLIQDEEIKKVFEEIDQKSIKELGFSPKQILENPKLKQITIDGVTYKHPEWIGTHTMFTQPIQTLLATLTSLYNQKIGLWSKGLRLEDKAGSSVGEFTMDAMAGVTDPWTAYKLTFMRGKFMSNVIDPLRDKQTGASPFSMYAILGVPKAVVDKAIANARKATVAAAQGRSEIKDPSKGLTVGIANINTPEQFVITGYDEAVQLVLKEINDYAMRVSARLGRVYDRAPYAQVAVDIPFHTWEILGDQVPAFRAYYHENRANFDMEAIRNMVDHSYPNLTGTRLANTKEYALAVYKQLSDPKQNNIPEADLADLKKLVDNWDAMTPDDRLFGLFVELRVFQFANTTRWSDSFVNMHKDGVRRFMPTLTVVDGQVKSTLKRTVKNYDNRASNPDFVEVVDLSKEGDFNRATYRDVVEAAVEAAESAPAVAVTQSRAAAPAAVATGPINDAPVPEFKLGDTTDPMVMTLRLLTGWVAAESGKFNILEVKDNTKISGVRGGGSQEMLKLGERLAKELGIAETDPRFQDAQGRTFSNLAEFAASELGAYKGPGAAIKELFGTCGFSVDFKYDTLTEYLTKEWRMPTSQVWAAMSFVIAAAKGWTNVAKPASLANAMDAMDFTDTAVAAFFQAQNIQKPSKQSEIDAARQAGGGGGINLDEAMPQILEAVNMDQARVAFKHATGQDLDVVMRQAQAFREGRYSADSAEVTALKETARKYGLVVAYMGDKAVDALTTPIFKSAEARNYHTNFASQQTLLFIYQLRFGELTNPTEINNWMSAIAKRADATSASIVDYWLTAPGNEEIKPILATFRAMIRTSLETQRTYRPDHVITMPTTVWKKDKYGLTGEAEMVDVPRVYPEGHAKAGQPIKNMEQFLDYLGERSQAPAPIAWDALETSTQNDLFRSWKRNHGITDSKLTRDRVEKIIIGKALVGNYDMEVIRTWTAFKAEAVLRLNSALSENAAHPDVYPMEAVELAKQAARDGISRVGETHLFTGATMGNINFSSVEAFLESGASVIIAVTDLQRHSPAWEEVSKRLLKNERVTILQYKAGNEADAKNVAKYIYQDLGVDLDGIHAFAAIMDMHTMTQGGEDKDKHTRDETRLVNEEAIRQMIAAVDGEKVRMHSPKRTVFTAACSDNDGGDFNHLTGELEGGNVGGDGYYADSKAWVKRLMARSLAEPWGQRFDVRGYRIPYVRGTHVNRLQDPTAAAVEQDGLTTFNTRDAAFFHNFVASDYAKPMFRQADGTTYKPRLVGFPGGLTRLGAKETLGETIGRKRAALEEQAQVYRAAYGDVKKAAEEADKASKARIEAGDFLKIKSPANPVSHKFTRPIIPDPVRFRDMQRTVPADRQIFMDPSKIVVTISMDEIGPGGDLESRWKMQVRQISATLFVELATQMMLIKSKGHLYIDLQESAKTGKEVLLTADQVMEKYQKHIESRVLIRAPEAQMMAGFDPKGTLMAFEVTYQEGGSIEIEASERSRYLGRDGKALPMYQIDDLVGGKYKVTYKPGAKGTMYVRVPTDTEHAGQVPTGYSAKAFGYTDAQLAAVPDKSAEYYYVAGDLTFARMGVRDPGKFINDVGPANVGQFSGSGIGPQQALADLFRADTYTRYNVDAEGRYQFDTASVGMRDVTLQNALLAAITNQYMMHKLGLNGENLGINGACAGYGNSLSAAYSAISDGKVKYAIVGAVDNGLNPYALRGFRAAKATRAGETAHGLRPDQMANAMTGDGVGFPIAEGANMSIVTTLEEALKRGFTPRQVVVYAGSSGNAQLAHPAPFPATLNPMSRGLQRAIRDFRYKADDPMTAHAHGTGTSEGDKSEVTAFLALFGWLQRKHGNSVPLSAIKNYLGHLLQPAMGMDVNTTAMTMATGIIPGSRNINNWHQVLKDNPWLVVNGENIKFDPLDAAGVMMQIIATYGFGQFNAATIMANPWDVMARLRNPATGAPLIDQKRYEQFYEAANARHDEADVIRDELFHGLLKFGDTLRPPTAEDMEIRKTDARKPGSVLLGPPINAFANDTVTANRPASYLSDVAVTRLNTLLEKSGIVTGRVPRRVDGEVNDESLNKLFDEVQSMHVRGESNFGSKNYRIVRDGATTYLFVVGASGYLPSQEQAGNLQEFMKSNPPLLAYSEESGVQSLNFYYNGRSTAIFGRDTAAKAVSFQFVSTDFERIAGATRAMEMDRITSRAAKSEGPVFWRADQRPSASVAGRAAKVVATELRSGASAPAGAPSASAAGTQVSGLNGYGAQADTRTPEQRSGDLQAFADLQARNAGLTENLEPAPKPQFEEAEVAPLTESLQAANDSVGYSSTLGEGQLFDTSGADNLTHADITSRIADLTGDITLPHVVDVSTHVADDKALKVETSSNAWTHDNGSTAVTHGLTSLVVSDHVTPALDLSAVEVHADRDADGNDKDAHHTHAVHHSAASSAHSRMATMARAGRVTTSRAHLTLVK